MALLQRNRPNQSGSSSTLARRPDEGMVPLGQVMQRLFQDSFLLPSVFDSFGGGAGAEASNLWETGDSYTLQVAMPGMKADSIHATVEQDVLTITASSALQVPDQGTAIWQTLGGEAAYRFQLPTEVESGAAEATYEGGILTVRLPKAAHAQAHTIKVTAR
jgi:HSP20 family protein